MRFPTISRRLGIWRYFLLLVTGALFVVHFRIPPAGESLHSIQRREYDSGHYLRAVELVETISADNPGGGAVTGRLADVPWKEPYLMLETGWQRLSVWLDGELYYSYPENYGGKVFWGEILLLPLPDGGGGRQIEIRTQNSYNGYHRLRAYVGNRGDLVLHVVQTGLVPALLSIVILTLGAVGAAFSARQRRYKNPSSTSGTTLFALLICLGLRIYIRSNLFYVVYNNAALHWLISSVAAIFTPVLLCSYLYTVPKGRNTVTLRINDTNLTFFVAAVILSALFPDWSPYLFLICYPVSLACCVLCAGLLYPVREEWRDERSVVYSVLALQALDYLDVFRLLLQAGSDIPFYSVGFACAALAMGGKLFSWVGEASEAEYDRHLAEHQLKAQLLHYNALAEMVEDQRILHHDLKKHLDVVRELCQQQKTGEAILYCDELYREYSRPAPTFYSDNPVLDAILNGAAHKAKRQNIRLELTVTVRPQLPIAPLDWCALMGNALDNALEACSRLDGQAPWIKVRMHQQQQMLYILVSNAAPPAQKTKKPWLFSSKGKYHGYGIKSMKKAIEKYSGTLRLSQTEREFRLEAAMLTLPAG